jgi:hypothetical protein
MHTAYMRLPFCTYRVERHCRVLFNLKMRWGYYLRRIIQAPCQEENDTENWHYGLIDIILVLIVIFSQFSGNSISVRSRPGGRLELEALN